MLPVSILNSLVNVRRRTSTGRDALGNPIYGAPTSGAGYTTVYASMAVKLAFSTKMTRFAPEGERIQPNGVMYYNLGYTLQPEDRVVTDQGIEYQVVSIVPAYLFGNSVSHYEAILILP